MSELYPATPAPQPRYDSNEAATQRPSPPRPNDPASSRPLQEPARRKDLLSPSADAAVLAAFESLGEAALPAHGRTVEDLVKEILRPMLKTWLDENLPRIAERLVRQEIERISRNAR